jgi:hypothetical protein
MSTNQITSVAIHPAIGIARVGNSPDGYFLGPQTPSRHPSDPDDFRDEQGRIKRQAVQFRLYGYNANGDVVRELTAADGTITWRAHVANTKAAWYQFSQALDVPASSGDVPGTTAIASPRRNKTIQGDDRQQLVIDPGQRIISGCHSNHNGGDPGMAFDSGTFFGKPVYLGELRTDASGHLIFLGGRGHSASANDEPTPGFANNPGWHDDTADGPVDATIELNGQTFQAKTAWVLVAPPNYAPGIQAFVTGYDLLYDVAVQQMGLQPPAKPHFYADIYPLLAHTTLSQWVNSGVARDYGWGSPVDFSDKRLLKRLTSRRKQRPFRQAIFERFRNPNYEVLQSNLLPPLYGDALTMQINSQDPREWMAIPQTHYNFLQQWADGDFVLDEPPTVYATADDIPLAERPFALDKAMLDETLGGPFHPGCEFTWPMRHALLYSEPFRLKRRATPEPGWGGELTTSIVLAPNGPLDGSGPGDITRWMACPWQTDTSSCLSAYTFYSGEYLPTFWPARVPNDVLTSEAYQTLLDPHASDDDKEAAFGLLGRRKWLRGVGYDYQIPATRTESAQTRREFVDAWPKVGIVVEKPLPNSAPLFPTTVWVETGRTLDEKTHKPSRPAHPSDLPLAVNR